ncbi:MAG: acyltransferase [Parafilimonas terrae]|nr:acyltransferase [Parafilimonas terrae]
MIAAAPTLRGGVPSREPSVGIATAGRELVNLQILRALAASLVLVHHVAAYGEQLRGAARPLGILDERMGPWGVSIFFALSGYLMAGLVTRDSPLTFLAHRVVRIYPTYLGVVALSAVVFAAFGLEFGGLYPLALSLAPTGPRSYPLNIEWSLVYEVTFYIGLFLLASAGLARRLVPVALAWVVVLLVAYAWDPAGSNAMQPPLYLLPVSVPCLAFAGGLLLPRLTARGWVRPWMALLALPLWGACIVLDSASTRLLGGVAAMLLVGGAVVARPVRRDGPVAPALIALGDWSYILYLVHPPVLLLTNWACPPRWPEAAFGAVGIAGALAATALLGPLDVALYRRLRARLGAVSLPTLRRGVSVFLLVFVSCAFWGSAETARFAYAESRARHALSALPAQVWASPAGAKAALAERGLALPASLLGSVEAATRLTAEEAVIRALAYDPAQPNRAMQLALFCDGRLLGIDRPRRMRKDLAGQPGFENLGHRRVGYRVRLATAPCAPEDVMAVAVDDGGRMAVLPGIHGGR